LGEQTQQVSFEINGVGRTPEQEFSERSFQQLVPVSHGGGGLVNFSVIHLGHNGRNFQHFEISLWQISCPSCPQNTGIGYIWRTGRHSAHKGGNSEISFVYAVSLEE